jgi:hypothetical protein
MKVMLNKMSNMRLNSSKLALMWLMSLLLAFGFTDNQVRVSGQQRAETKSAVVFAVFGGSAVGSGTMEPFVIIEGGEYKNPVAGDSTAEELSQFAGSYYRAGQKYRLLSGGGEAGSVTVKKDTRDQECERSGAEVKLETKVKFNRNVMALATNSDALGRAKSSRRPPTPEERAAVVRLVKQAYLAKGVSAGLMPTLETVNLTAVDVNSDGKAELAGSFVVKKTKGGAARYVMFLLAEPQGNDYRAVVSNYQKYTNDDVMSGGDIDAIGAGGIYTERLVDQLDLDADGTGEVITIFNGFEGDTYHIYKKAGGGWRSVYEFGKYRCAF